MKHISFIILIFFVSFQYSTYSQPNPPDERQRSYDVQHIKIEVTLDLKKKTVDGMTTTSLVPLNDKFNTFEVDATGMKIKSVKLTTSEHPSKFKEVKYTYSNNEINIHTDNIHSINDTLIYSVEYTTQDPEKGMYFIAPDSINPNKQYEVWTQGEGEDNHYWFPCYDYPNDKATVETIITIDSQYSCVSNGVLVDIRYNHNGTSTYHYSLDKPYSSYLVMLAAGEFGSYTLNYSIPVSMYYPKGRDMDAHNAFDNTGDIITFFNKYIGFEYPWHTFSQTVVEDFVYGGMENTGAVVLTDVSLYDDGHTKPDYTPTGLIAHELAHQWWGDVVTCKNWNETWLNEGFATYFDALYKEYSTGKDEFDYTMYSNQQAVLYSDSIHRLPIYTNHGSSANNYNKGACVLDMLRYVLGDEDFKQALNYYITQHQFQCVTTEDLIKSINHIFLDPTRDRIPRDYHWFFDEWIYKAGEPEYKVSYTYNDSTKQILYTVQQVQDTTTSSEFHMPVNVEIITANQRFTQIVYPIIELHTYIFTVDSKPLCLNFNKGNKVLCKLNYTKPKEDWIYQLKNSEDAIDRITAIKGLKDFINDEDVLDALFSSIKNDAFWGVREETAEMLGNATDKGVPLKLMEIYQNEKDSRVRRGIFSGLGEFYKNCNTCVNKDTLVSFILNTFNNEWYYYSIADGITALSKIADKDKLFDMVLPFADKESNNEIIRRSVTDAMIISENDSATDYFIKFAVHTGNNRLRWAALKGLGKHLNDQKVIDVLNSIVNIHNEISRSIVINLLTKAGNPTSKPFLEDALKKTSDDDMKTILREAIDAIK